MEMNEQYAIATAIFIFLIIIPISSLIISLLVDAKRDKELEEETKATREHAELNLDAQKAMYSLLHESIRSKFDQSGSTDDDFHDLE